MDSGASSADACTLKKRCKRRSSRNLVGVLVTVAGGYGGGYGGARAGIALGNAIFPDNHHASVFGGIALGIIGGFSGAKITGKLFSKIADKLGYGVEEITCEHCKEGFVWKIYTKKNPVCPKCKKINIKSN